MRSHKFAKILCPVLAVTLLTGCDAFNKALDYTHSMIVEQAESRQAADPECENYTGVHGYTVNMWHKVRHCVEDKETQKLFDLFSEYNRNNVELMPDIEKLVDFLDGEIVEIGQVGASSDYSSVRDGVTIKAGYSAKTFVTTDKGTKYWFRVGVVTAADDETKLGLDWIYILNCAVQSEHTNAWVEWRENNFDDKKAEPKVPDNMTATVNY